MYGRFANRPYEINPGPGFFTEVAPGPCPLSRGEMMKVKLLTRWLAVSGKNPGDVVDLPDAQAQDGIARGICKKVGKGPEVDLKAENEQLQVENEQLKDLVDRLNTQIKHLLALNEKLEAQAADQTAEETKPATEKTGGKGKDVKSSSGKGKAK